MSYEEFDYGELVSSEKLNSNYAALSQDITTATGSLQTSVNNLNNTVTSLGNTVNGLTNIINNGGTVQTGTVIWYTKSTAPTGYLVCDGSAVSRTDYADLFAIIGTTFGAGDSTTTFNLPDLIDQFIEGSATVGTKKTAGLPNLTIARYYTESLGVGGTAFSLDFGYDQQASVQNPIYGNSTTVQPPALTLLPCIKY